MKGFVKKSFVFVLSLLALSCSNMFNPSCDEKEESSLPDGYIEFKVDTKNDFSRMAVPRAFADGVYYRLKIYKAGDEDNCVYSKYQTTLSFTIPAPAWTGSSVVKLDMYCPTADQLNTDSDGNTVLQKSTSDDSALDPCMTGTQDFNLKANTRVFNHTINLAFAGTEAGTIKLFVTVGGTGIKSCIIVPDSAGTDASKYIKAEVTGSGTIYNLFVAPFSDHALFYFFKAGVAELPESVSNDYLENALVMYSDSITVFPNTTTDKWFGSDGDEKNVDLDSLQYSTMYVASDGDDKNGGSSLYPVKKLSTAIARCAQAENGGTIYLKSQPGDTEKIVIDKKVKIEKLSTATGVITLPDIEIKGFSSETAVSLKGVKISASGKTGITVGEKCSLTLDNVEVSGCEKGIYAENECTVNLTNSTDSTKPSVVKDCTGYGIQLKNSSGILKINGTDVNSDKAATSTFDSCDLYYPKGKVVRLNAPCSDVSKNDDILKEAFDAVGGFGNGSVLLLGKTTSTSVAWEIKENGISVTTGTSGSTYTVKPVNSSCNVTIKRDSGASRQFALLSATAYGTWKISNFTFEGGLNTTQTDISLNSDGKGGAVYLKNGTLDLTSCSFANNSAQNGGAVYIESGTVYLTACTIGGSSTTANTANENGGAFYLEDSSAKLVMNTGTIGNNQATFNGGAVYLAGTSASLEMNNGAISSNTAKNGGGVYIASGAEALVKGGLVTSNTATEAGGAFYQGGTFKVSGYTYITPGSAPLANDVYLASGKYVEVTGALSPKEYGSSHGSDVDYTALITPSEWKRGLQVLTGTGASGSYSKIKGSESEWLTVSDTNDSDKVKLYTSYKIYVAGTGKANDIGTGKTAANGGLGTKEKPYASIEEAVKACWNAKQAFTVYLSGSLNGSAQTVPAKDTTAKTGLAESILLTGYTGNSSDVINRNLTAVPASGSGTALTINNTAPVTIKKIKITGGYTNGNGGGINIASGTTVKLADDVLVSGNTAKLGGGIYNAGTLFMYKNAIVGYSASSIITTYASGYTYERAVISKGGNVATGDGAGGIYNASGTIYLGYSTTTSKDNDFSGGVIGNYASSQGGGIFMKGGNLYMNKGNISWNKTETAGGGGVRVSNSAKMYMYGGSIKGNTVATNGGGLYVGGSETLEMSGGTIEANTGTTGGAIYNNSGGTVKLSASAYIPYGVGVSKGKGKNDVYGDNFNISDLTPPSECTDGIVATVYPSSYAETTQMIKNTAGYVYAPAISVIPQSSQTWGIFISTGKLITTTVMTNSSLTSFTPSSGTKYNFVIPADVDQGNLGKFLDKLFNHNDTPTIGADSSIDFSKVTSHIRFDSGIVGGGSDRRTNNITTFIVPGGSGDIYFDFSTDKALTSVKEYIAPADSENYTCVDGVLYNKDMTELIKYPSGRTNTAFTIPDSVQRVYRSAFYGAIYLQQITIPDSVISLGESAFYESGIRSVTIPGNEDILNGGSIFQKCESLSTVTINNGVKYIGTELQAEVFKDCTKLKTVSIPNSVIRIGRYSFENCFNYSPSYSGSITVPSGVTFLGRGVFTGCTYLSLTFNCPTSGWKYGDGPNSGDSVSSSYFTTSEFVSGSYKLLRE